MHPFQTIMYTSKRMYNVAYFLATINFNSIFLEENLLTAP